jgi:PEP-CTERM motif
MKVLCVILGLMFVTSIAADASIIASLVSVTGGPGNYTWTYSATLSGDERLDPAATAATICAGGQLCSPAGLNPASGSFFTIDDFAGYNGTTTVPSGNWKAFTALTGTTPASLSPTDSASIVNVSFFYNGPVVGTIGTVTNLGNFTIGSTFGTQVTGVYTAQATKNSTDASNGTLEGNLGAVNVPTSSTPEPGSMLFLGIGLVSLSVLRRSQRCASRDCLR